MARQELEEEEEDAGDGGIDAGEGNDTDEEVEILVSFEEDGREYHLVRLLDPVLLVGKVSLPPRAASSYQLPGPTGCDAPLTAFVC